MLDRQLQAMIELLEKTKKHIENIECVNNTDAYQHLAIGQLEGLMMMIHSEMSEKIINSTH